MEITQEHLKSVMHYTPETGDFTWGARGRRRTLGGICGSIDKEGYRVINLNHKAYFSHRLAFLYMNGRFPDAEIDHIDGHRSNNAWDNLRIVTRLENCLNASRKRNNTSGVTGVSWNKAIGKWVMYIQAGDQHKTNCFSDFFEAVCARKSAEISYGFHKNHGRENVNGEDYI